MLKKRVIPMMLLRSGRLVKGRGFCDFRDVGDPVKSAAVYDSQLADELLFLNIGGYDGLSQLITDVAEKCFMPIAIGGGISTLEDVVTLIRNGADKVVINSAAYSDPDLIRQASLRFGSQAVTVGVDVRLGDDYTLWSHGGSRRQDMALEEHIDRVCSAGAGEIMIQSIDRDGAMSGYDLELVRRVVAMSPVPVIAAGGAGNYEHLRQVLAETDVNAAACGSLWNFTDSNPLRAKSYLSNHGVAVRAR